MKQPCPRSIDQPDASRSILFRGLRAVFCNWPDRHGQRSQLKELDADQLRDIGISKEQAKKEARKPFWR
ncbi:DUF1127 domain-containing protein [Tianweitania populi]|uniref:DUF1127 domain-containing protein n=1 Tax=Tianweitania populi TaxID=1607949 RepID=UPI000DE3750A|nr:DUF1127 domain-containing protein [Tianweitania populi]